MISNSDDNSKKEDEALKDKTNLENKNYEDNSKKTDETLNTPCLNVEKNLKNISWLILTFLTP